jgi:hypothetical protein
MAAVYSIEFNLRSDNNSPAPYTSFGVYKVFGLNLTNRTVPSHTDDILLSLPSPFFFPLSLSHTRRQRRVKCKDRRIILLLL